jgi:hypothetical protein
MLEEYDQREKTSLSVLQEEAGELLALNSTVKITEKQIGNNFSS